MTGVGWAPPCDRALAPALVLGGLGRPRDVVDRAGALDAALGRRRVVRPGASAALAPDLPAVARRARSPDAPPAASGWLDVGRERPRALEALERVLGGHLGVLGDQRLVIDRRDDELVLEPLGVAEAESVAAS